MTKLPGISLAFFMDTVEKRIYRLPEGQFELAVRVRELILSAHPAVTEKLHFSTPFFSCKGWLCFLNIVEGRPGVEVSFAKGNLLSDKHGQLVARNRKVARSLIYADESEFDEPVFLETLLEAIQINLMHQSSKKKSRA
jgi:hypothetical protein